MTYQPTIVGWAVHRTNDLRSCAMYPLSEKEAAFDAAKRWGANITALSLHPSSPEINMKSPKILDKIADVVLAYKPKPKSKPAKKRARRKKKIQRESSI